MNFPENQRVETSTIYDKLNDMSGGDEQLSWPRIGSKNNYEFTTQGIATMCFHELFK